MSKPVLSRAALAAAVGQEIACSGWERLDQARIDAFAQVSGDHQFIHTDPARAMATPFGGTIAHGMLSLSVISGLASGVLPDIEGQGAVLNYGFDAVRFISPVRSGAMIRARFDLLELTPRGRDNLMVRYGVRAQIKGETRPALSAEWLLLYS